MDHGVGKSDELQSSRTRARALSAASLPACFHHFFKNVEKSAMLVTVVRQLQNRNKGAKRDSSADGVAANFVVEQLHNRTKYLIPTPCVSMIRSKVAQQADANGAVLPDAGGGRWQKSNKQRRNTRVKCSTCDRIVHARLE